MLYRKTSLNVLFQSLFSSEKFLTIPSFYKQDSTVKFLSVRFSTSSRSWNFGMTSLYFFRIGSGLLLRLGTISLRRYKLHHISSSRTQTYPGIRRVNLGVVFLYPNSLTLGLPLWETEVQRRTLSFLISRWTHGNAQNKTLIMLERTKFSTSLLWMECNSWSDGKSHVKARTINESYRQYVNINVHVSCFTITVVQENITICVMLNYLCVQNLIL